MNVGSVAAGAGRECAPAALDRALLGGPSTSPLERMRNIQVIDAAVNAVYDVFAATDEEFALIFPEGHDIAFIDEVLNRRPRAALDEAFARIWKRRIPKAKVAGIHGLLFYDLAQKKPYYPTRRDEEAVNPDGSRLR